MPNQDVNNTDRLPRRDAENTARRPALPSRQGSAGRPRKLMRFALLLCGVLVVLTVAWAVTSAVDKNPLPASSVVSASRGTPSYSLPNAASLGDPLDASAWNHAGAVDATVNNPGVATPDARMLALPENGRVELTYFNTATFLGDSLTQGLQIPTYKALPDAKYCAYKGVSIRAFYDGTVCTRADNVSEVPMDALVASQPDNIYILLGANDMMNRTDEAIVENYRTLIETIRQKVDPRVEIYVQSLTPVKEGTPRFDMDRIRGLNNQIAWMARDMGCHYLDLMEPLAGPDGFLREEYAGSDGYHMNPTGYAAWVDYLATHTVTHPRNPYIEGGAPYRVPQPEPESQAA